MTARVGLLVGRERTFPEALIAEVARRGASVTCEYAIFDAPRADVAPPIWARPARMDFTSVPSSLMPAANRSFTSCS